MTITKIQAVVFDMGGTLENLYYDDTIRLEATQSLHQLLCDLDLDPGLSLPDLQTTVLSGMKGYQTWRAESEIELPPERVWTDYIFANHGLSKERLMNAAEDISFFYETRYHIRSLRPEAPTMLKVLRDKGSRLAVISNIISRQLVPRQLAKYGIAHYFDPVVTSSGTGSRKPNERIFLETARLMGLPPAACAYVGDTISRDVIGARRAGYGLAIQIESFLTHEADKGTDTEPPDAVIHDLMEIVGLVTQDSNLIGF